MKEIDFPPEEQDRRDKIKMRCLLLGFLTVFAGPVALFGANRIFWTCGPNFFSCFLGGLTTAAFSAAIDCFHWSFSVMRRWEFSLKKERKRGILTWIIFFMLGFIISAVLQYMIYQMLLKMGMLI